MGKQPSSCAGPCDHAAYGLPAGAEAGAVAGRVVGWAGCAEATNRYGFGAAHSVGFQMAFCDGAVQMMSYSIDREIHRRLGNRKDGQTIDAKAF